jgi:hypothetical protein
VDFWKTRRQPAKRDSFIGPVQISSVGHFIFDTPYIRLNFKMALAASQGNSGNAAFKVWPQ